MTSQKAMLDAPDGKAEGKATLWQLNVAMDNPFYNG
jgi:hypothetical protein